MAPKAKKTTVPDKTRQQKLFEFKRPSQGRSSEFKDQNIVDADVASGSQEPLVENIPRQQRPVQNDKENLAAQEQGEKTPVRTGGKTKQQPTNSPGIGARRAQSKPQRLPVGKEVDPDVIEFREVEDKSFHTVTESQYNGVSPTYGYYADESPLIQAGFEKLDETSLVLSPEKAKPTMNTRQGAKKTKQGATYKKGTTHIPGFDDDDDEEPPKELSMWESRGRQFVDAIALLVGPKSALSPTLQEFLMHIALNHGLHKSDLSRRAMRVLERNLELHSAVRLPDKDVDVDDDDDVGRDDPQAVKKADRRLIVNKSLWLPTKDFRFEHERCPSAIGPKFRPFNRYVAFWRHAHQHVRGEEPSAEQELKSDGRPGALLLLQYWTKILHQDLQARLALIAKDPKNPKALATITDSLYFKLFVGISADRWSCPGFNLSHLVLYLVTSLIVGNSPPHTQADQEDSDVPGPCLRDSSKKITKFAARSEAMSRQQVADMAAQTLSDLSALFTMLEANHLKASLYRRSNDRSTDRHALVAELLMFMTGLKLNGGEVNIEAADVATELKDPRLRLCLVRCLDPETQLILLTMHLIDRASKTWPAGLPATAQLLGVLRDFEAYHREKGLVQGAKVNPLDVLNCLLMTATPSQDSKDQNSKLQQVPDADVGVVKKTKTQQDDDGGTQAGEDTDMTDVGEGASQQAPGGTQHDGDGDAPRAAGSKRKRGGGGGWATAYDQSVKSLLLAGVGADHGGFSVWLTLFLLASVQVLQARLTANPPHATASDVATFKEQHARLQQQLLGDEDRLSQGRDFYTKTMLQAAHMAVQRM